MYDTDVLIVGAGPTGLTLAATLVARGVRATVVDRQAAGTNTSRAAVVNARTLEVRRSSNFAPSCTISSCAAKPSVPPSPTPSAASPPAARCRNGRGSGRSWIKPPTAAA